MAEAGYYEERSGFGYYETRNGFHYYVRRDTGAPPPGPSPPPLLTSRVLEQSYLLSVDFGAGQIERFSYGHRAPLIDGNMWRPCIARPLSISQNITDSSGVLRTQVAQSFGSIVISLEGGFTDPLLDLDWRNKPFKFFRGPVSQNFSLFELIQPGYILQSSANDRELTLTVTDGSHLLRVPVANQYFQGTGLQPSGEDEGTGEIAGLAKPRLIGFGRNVSPVLVDPLLNIYQYNNTDVSQTFLANDAGGRLSYDGNVGTDLPALTTVHDWVEDPGHWVSDHARGVIRLGAPAVGIVTLTVVAENVNAIGAMVMLAETYGPATLSTASLNANDHFPDSVGIYLSENETPLLSDMFSRIAASLGGYWYVDRNSRLRVERIQIADVAESKITDDDILMNPAPVIFRLRSPIHRVTAQYRKNQTVMSSDQILPAETTELAEFRDFATREYLSVIREDLDVEASHPEARDIVLSTIFTATETTPAALADLALANGSPDLRFIQFSLVNLEYTCFIGKTVEVEIPGFHIKGIILAVAENLESRRTAVTVMGKDI